MQARCEAFLDCKHIGKLVAFYEEHSPEKRQERVQQQQVLEEESSCRRLISREEVLKKRLRTTGDAHAAAFGARQANARQ